MLRFGNLRYGKVLIVNTLMASLFMYKMQVIPLNEMMIINDIEDAISDFFWKGKKAKISLKVMCKSKDGGLGLRDIRIQQDAITLNWIKIVPSCTV